VVRESCFAAGEESLMAHRQLFAMTLCSVLGCVIPISATPLPDAGLSGQSGDGGPAGSVILGGDAAPASDWINVTANLVGAHTSCGNLTGVFIKPDEDMVIAGVAAGGLWASVDGSQTWQSLGAQSTAPINNRPTGLVFDPMVPSRYWESGTYGGCVFQTMDDGQSFVQLGAEQHCDLVSVDLSGSSRMTLLAGGHEQSRTLYLSVDGGATWNNVGGGLPDGSLCTLPLVIDSRTYLVGCRGYNVPTGIYRTTDGAATWTSVAMAGGGSAPLVASDGSIYWGGQGGEIVRSTDQGQTWTQTIAGGMLEAISPTELPDGRLASLGGGNVVLSSDHGTTWRPVAALPYSDAAGISYSSRQGAFFTSHWNCSNSIPSDAVMRFNFNYLKN
jgi:photosystem II stability/assembly factor-like uncharacterized protein